MVRYIVLLTLLLTGNVIDWRVGVPQVQLPEDQRSPSGIDRDIELFRKDIRSNTRQLIASNLTLSNEQATHFWAVYDRYSEELSKVNDQRYQLDKQYADERSTINNEMARTLIGRALLLDQRAAEIRTKYYGAFEQATNSVTAARFYQLDRRIQVLIDLQVTSPMILIQQ